MILRYESAFASIGPKRLACQPTGVDVCVKFTVSIVSAKTLLTKVHHQIIINHINFFISNKKLP